MGSPPTVTKKVVDDGVRFFVPRRFGGRAAWASHQPEARVLGIRIAEVRGDFGRCCRAEVSAVDQDRRSGR
jgi:hypothetical protein